MIIRICTEDKGNEPEIHKLIQKHFDAYTIYRGCGAWKGQEERSLTIDIAALDLESLTSAKFHAIQLALEIKRLNNQEAVLIEYIESTNELI